MKQKLLDKMYQELQEMLNVESDSEEMELVYKIVALELVIDEEKEYIIVDSNDNWLYMGIDKEDAKEEYKKFKKMSVKNEEYCFMEVGDTIYLYEAVEIKRNRT